MKTLFLAWQHTRPDPAHRTATRAWYPVGRLDSHPEESFYSFGYTQGAKVAAKEAGFTPLVAFPDFRQHYESGDLFPVFRNRLIQPTREDYRDYLMRLGLKGDETDPIEILAVTGGGRQTDNLEVFPKIQKRRDGSFTVRFFLHGWSHVNLSAQERVRRLQPGEPLRVALELNNPATAAAVQLQTADDYHMIGWAPRYLVADMLNAMSESSDELNASVLRVNPPPAPHNQRVLIQLEGRFPSSFEPMSGPQYQPLT